MSKLIEEFDSLENDKARWGFVLAHKGKLRLLLDNDQTMVIDDSADDEDNNNVSNFVNYVGRSVGVIDLLHAIGIDTDSCMY